jgi:hypothetical protein
MIVSCGSPPDYHTPCRPLSEFRARLIAPRTKYAQAQPKSRPRKAQAAEGMPRPDRDETKFEYGCGLSLGLISPITSSRPGHTGVSPRCTHKGFDASGDAPLSSELRHCTAYPEFLPEATWAQPLSREELS